MTSKEIRNSFIHFFEKYDHKFVKSSPVVPFDDPSLLFTNAGMNQFKNIFLGLEKRNYIRAANSQKCIRVSGKHNDLEEVGKDTYHHTFFEMLGNWSFGDYYKKEAIIWAWELLTDVWKLPKPQMWATVYKDDAEAEELWKKYTDINKDQVLRFDEKDNFWEMGDVGPCGPCSEIHIDLGEESCDKKHIPGHECEVNGGCARYIELWNLVFMQYNREQDGSLTDLVAKNIDTGMGFERITAVIQGVGSNYDTDLFVPLIQKIAELTGKEYNSSDEGTPHRVISDHIRSLTFAIADGALPSNEGRGYVLRRILRRAARFVRKLDMHEPVIYKLVPTLIDIMGDAFPEIKEKEQYVSMVIKAEEESFNNTVDRGIELFEKLIVDLKKKNTTRIPGKEVFKLYDTYGFPIDLTRLMAEENDFTIDEQGFEAEMEKQRERARQAGKWEYAIDFNYDNWDVVSDGVDSKFVGYEKLESESHIRRIKREGDYIFLTLDVTPFYGEAGGQVGDKGVIFGNGFELNVINTIREGEKIIHIVQGDLPSQNINPVVRAVVDADLRMSTARNHTATHLLQAALRKVLGTHVHQSGSFVGPDRMRFDLTHFERIPKEQLLEIEKIVNQKIMEDMTVDADYLNLDTAREKGAMMIFGEKYDEVVRMITIDDFSKELCGGTHLTSTGQMGQFRITSESSVAAGIRRVEAVTGNEAFKLSLRERDILDSVREKLGANTEEIFERIDTILEEKKSLEKELNSYKTQRSKQEIEVLVQNAKQLDGFKLVSSKVDSPDVDFLKRHGDLLRDALKSGVGVLGAEINGKVNFLCVVTDDLIKDKKLNAGNLVKQIAAIAGGSGGGRPHMALAGAKNPQQLESALNQVETIIKENLK
ncbi:alanine--tRNA ligase [candidate division KSB1 bacterium]|nr:alanine--tRNA ligase [candidate division KSB1 bacterium]